MRILITGADGFIGSHLTEKLLSLGHHVTALSFYNSFGFIGWLNDVKKKTQFKNNQRRYTRPSIYRIKYKKY